MRFLRIPVRLQPELDQAANHYDLQFGSTLGVTYWLVKCVKAVAD